MKKITLLMTVLMWSSMFYAQTYLTEGFEGVTFPPTGWVEEIAPGSFTNPVNKWNFSTVHANSGTRSAFYNDFNGDATDPMNIIANDRWLITPVMDLSGATSPELTYYEYVDNTADFAGISEVYFSTDYNGSNFATAMWTPLNTTLGTDAEDNWKLRGPTFLNVLPINATVYVAFRYKGANKHDWWVDDVLVRETPTCVEPSAASFSSITMSSASFSWTPQGTETLWDVELVDITAGGTPAGTPTTTGVTNPYTFNSLADGNMYEAYVRADCGGSTSAWAGPFAFVTRPNNDDCAQAQVIVHELEIATRDFATPTSGTINGATDSGLAAVVCNGLAGSADDDVWFAFVAIGPDVNITFDMAFDGVAELYSTTDNTCGTTAFLVCADNNITAPAQEEINATGLTPGNTYYVRIFSWDTAPAVDGNFTIKIWSSEALSNNEFDLANAFKYYPNPVNNELNLRAQNNIENVSIYNMLGQEILRVAPNANSSEIDMSALQTGAYFIRVTINGITETKQIIKR